MANLLLYSTNPWIAHDISKKYLKGIHFVWCSEYFDPKMAPHGSAEYAVAPSSSPKGIFQTLKDDCEREDDHSQLIIRYKKTFSNLARAWLADSTINKDQYDEILTTVRSKSWKIWRPVLYLIPKEPIKSSCRLITVPRKSRASIGPELKIENLTESEFDFIEGLSI
jgi:hypothetical protein